MTYIDLLLTYSLTFLIIEMDGPFDSISKIRNTLMTTNYIGVFFYKLFNCYYCSGFWAGIIVSLLKPISIQNVLTYGFVGAISSFLINSIFKKVIFIE